MKRGHEKGGEEKGDMATTVRVDRKLPDFMKSSVMKINTP